MVLTMDTVQEYFSQLNPIANKIAQDIYETKVTYEQIWSSLKASERIDIINETLIKPEISLHYFDKCSSLLISQPFSASNFTSYCVSIDSLNPASMKRSATNKEFKQYESYSSDAKSSSSSLKQHYGFNRRNLSTFALQKVALKIVNDDTLGTYRDEHSKPFSYKTRSQLSLNIFTEKEDPDEKMCMFFEKPQGKIISNIVNVTFNEMLSQCKDFQKTSTNLDCTKGKNCLAVGSDDCKDFHISNNKNNTKIDNQNPNNSMSSHSALTTAEADVTNHKLLQTFETVVNFRPAFNSAVFTDPYYVHEENINLMSNFSNGLLTATSSSTVTSDDDQDESKTLCEEVKLLDNDISLRKGFDFLNNW